MAHRSLMTAKERDARSRAAQILHNAEMIAGSIVTMRRVCGKAGCRCTRGEKHVSQYLALNVGGKRKMVIIPAELLDEVKGAVDAHKKLRVASKTISQACYARLMARRKE